MTSINTSLPHQTTADFVTDGGLETTLIFHRGIDLPHFAAFVLLESEAGRETLADYYLPYASVARDADCGFIYETPTWRSNPDWGERLGYDSAALDRVNRESVRLMAGLRDTEAESAAPRVISGCIGPRGDGYVAGEKMDADTARAYHAAQAASFAAAGADLVTGLTMTYPEEAIGVTRAAADAGLPAVISFTTETDGRLPDGTDLQQAIAAVDAATDGAPAYYMLNCAHPDHFRDALIEGEDWTRRIRGIRANASRMSHAELDEAETLDAGDPQELGQIYAELRSAFPGINVVGGCCGTDHRHVAHMCPTCH
jgi:homocysteine S-methyltransferase